MTLDDFAIVLDQWADRAGDLDLTALLAGDVLDVVNEGIAANFKAASNPDGQAWAPRKDKLSHPLLIKSGELLSEAGGKAGYTIVEPNLLVKGTELEYAGFQNSGTSKMPAREFMGLSEEYLQKVEGVVADGVLEAVFGEFIEGTQSRAADAA